MWSIIWLALFVVLIVFEAVTTGLFTIWFAGGAVIALAASLLGAGIAVQVVLFFVISVVLLISTRKLFVKKLQTGAEKTNVDALVGKEAVVISAVKPFEPGIIKLSGQEWTAVSENSEESLAEGSKVKVIRIEGVKAVVAPWIQ